VLRLHLFGFDGFGVASNAASRRQVGHGCPSTTRATVAPCAGSPHPQHPLRRRPPQATLLRRRQGGHTRRRTLWTWHARAWMVLSPPLYHNNFGCYGFIARPNASHPVPTFRKRWPRAWMEEWFYVKNDLKAREDIKEVIMRPIWSRFGL
jgi:hypothetical protein